MEETEIIFLEFINNSTGLIYDNDVDMDILAKMHRADYIIANSDTGYACDDEADIYHLTEKGQCELEAHYLEQRLKTKTAPPTSAE